MMAEFEDVATRCAVVVAIRLVAPLHLVSQPQGRHDSIVARARWLWLVLCFIAFPFTARVVSSWPKEHTFLPHRYFLVFTMK